jgi:hypothetical protein
MKVHLNLNIKLQYQRVKQEIDNVRMDCYCTLWQIFQSTSGSWEWFRI